MEKKKVKRIINNIIYYTILIPCLVFAIRITYQKIVYPDKIPDIFGWKMFMIFDDNMAEELENGDLAFTQNINAHKLKENDIIAFRNKANTVTIHKIEKVEEKIVDNKPTKNFTMKTQPTETIETKYASEKNVEGILKHRIPKLGAIVFFIQKTPVTIGISCAILTIGGIWIFIARKLDKKEKLKLEQKELEKQIEQPEKEPDKTLSV